MLVTAWFGCERVKVPGHLGWKLHSVPLPGAAANPSTECLAAAPSTCYLLCEPASATVARSFALLIPITPRGARRGCMDTESELLQL
jgi:hypothetical protein